MTKEVKDVEKAVSQERKERAVLERRLRKALLEQNVMASKLAEALRCARDRHVIPSSQHEKDMEEKDSQIAGVREQLKL
eukprot:6182821-Pleurochrysis_carterae.AAC.1